MTAEAGMDLRPLPLGELLDRTFTLYRNRLWLLFGIVAPPVLLFVAANFFVSGFFVGAMVPPKNADPAAQSAAVMRNALGLIGGVSLQAVATILVYAIAFSAVTIAVSEIYLGRSISLRDAYRRIPGVFGRLIGLMGVYLFLLLASYLGGALGIILVAVPFSLINPVAGGVALIIGFLGVLVLICWVMVRFALAIPVLVIERAGVFRSLARSGRLSAGYRWRVFLIFLMMAAITYGITILFQLPAFGIVLRRLQGHPVAAWLQVLASLLGGLGSALSLPILTIALTLLYYDVRVRKEGFDLEILMGAAGTRSAVPPSAPPEVPPAASGA